MPVRKVREFLDSNGVKYIAISHSPFYTAQEIAASAHVPGRELAKTVIVKIDGEIALTVLPASHKVDFSLLKSAVGASSVELATEDDFRDRFPGCEVGAMPPFGNLYGLPVYVSPAIAHEQHITFNGGDHQNAFRLRYADFDRLASPRVVPLANMSFPPPWWLHDGRGPLWDLVRWAEVEPE